MASEAADHQLHPVDHQTLTSSGSTHHHAPQQGGKDKNPLFVNNETSLYIKDSTVFNSDTRLNPANTSPSSGLSFGLQASTQGPTHIQGSEYRLFEFASNLNATSSNFSLPTAALPGVHSASSAGPGFVHCTSKVADYSTTDIKSSSDVTQPISIPTIGANTSFIANHSTSSTMVFQQVTPFGTPSNSSITNSFALDNDARLPAVSLGNSLVSSGAFFPTTSATGPPSRLDFEPISIFPLGNGSLSNILSSNQIASSLPATSNFLKPKLKKCPIEGCFDKVAKIIGDCKYCDSHFCAVHRLPEQHDCSHIKDLQKELFEKNSSKLLKEKCVANKI